MPRIHFTPWKKYSELLSLRDHFFPPPSYQGSDMREKACSLVEVWKARGNVPNAVEGTALLTAAILHDDPDKHSVYSIQATYSTAFCRFVTALVDKTVHGRRQSMYHLAQEIGIPASFVELRHEAAHRDMPSLITLRRVAQRSLEWLWQYYWTTIEDVSSAGDANEFGAEGGLSLNSRLAKDETRRLVDPVVQRASGPSLSIKGRRVFERDNATPITKALSEICLSHGAALVAQVLLEDGILASQSTSIDDQMDAVFSAWEPLLLALCQQQTPFLTTLVEEAVKLLVSSSATDEKEPGFYQKGIYMWLEHILCSSTEWAGMREQYLVLSYAQTVCRESSGYWAERLRLLIGDLPMSQDISMGDNFSRSKTMVNREVERAATATNRSGDDADIAALREYGWAVSEARNSKPMGVI